MKVLALSDYKTLGGAAISASRLIDGLKLSGVDVIRAVSTLGDREYIESGTIVQDLEFSRRWQRIINIASTPAEEQRVDSLKLRAEKWLASILEKTRPDIINVHNLHSAAWMGWGPGLISIASKFAPIVWTLHDMWSITGRCGYNYECLKYLSGCDSECPTWSEYPVVKPNKIWNAWDEKKKVLNNAPNITAVAPSQWLAHEAKRGLWSQKDVRRIPYGLPLKKFRLLDRICSRRQLGLPEKGLCLLVAAADLSERRKGGDYLLHALENAKIDDYYILTLGSGKIQIHPAGKEVYSLGFCDNIASIEYAYNAADLMIHAAPVDNFPNVVLESMACGTPVAGFPIGGVAEMIRNGETGWLAESVSGEALAAVVEEAVFHIREGRSLRQSCRADVEKLYPLELQAKRYIELFEELLCTKS